MAETQIKTNSISIVSRGSLFLFVWWLLTDGIMSSLWVGVPAVLLAVIVSIALVPPVTLIWYELLKFVPFFVIRSLLGGADVAWRAFRPNIPIAPDFINYSLRLPAGLPQVFMVSAVNLLPGTLSATLEEDILKVHVLNRESNFLRELEMVEHHVARLFGIPLINPSRDK